ncbi:rod shape-determining protein MreC [Yeosuana sp. MJ-SS3]|uniref:Cell shape-determining protein MreC n=1 Tax=Gilvirhabdus luticola TaxID=3079858 RepID=A0ABU3U5R8_9FLAO|nr:rod shape-determining protein MreC [Yeosuana sp. MJ-SS3]MDU8885748.1 rod shape-determining protein MreC [Yeosuana sp. MJ-SS3]
MQQIVNFIIRNKTFLLFLLLFVISLVLTIQSHSYHQSKFVHSANFLSGGIYKSANNISQYFSLKRQNEILSEENSRLNTLIYNGEDSISAFVLDSSKFGIPYEFTAAKVIKNSYSLSNNILLIDKGKRDSLAQDFGVINSKGIIGIIDNVSKKYATVISVLNSSISISAKLKKTNHFGSLAWDSKSHEFIQLIDIPKIAPVEIGDTIVTSGRSTIFPRGIQIGVVNDFKLDAAENYYNINIKLFNDMTNIEHVYVIKNIDAEEIDNLLNGINE